MATKKHQVAKSHMPGPTHEIQPTDWNTFILFQTVRKVKLQCLK